MASCGYTGRHFGAGYEDATCIDGYLWDLDSCDEPGGPLTIGGDQPCPKCNTREFLADAREYALGTESASITIPGLSVTWTGEEFWTSAQALARRVNPTDADALINDLLAKDTAHD